MIVLVLSCFGAQALDPRPRRGLAKVTCNCTNYPDVNTGLSSATGLVQYCSDCDCTIWNQCSATTTYPTAYPTHEPTDTLAPTMGAVIVKPTYDKLPPIEGCITAQAWEDPWSYNCQYYSTDHNLKGEIWTAEMEKMAAAVRQTQDKTSLATMKSADTNVLYNSDPYSTRVPAWCKEGYITHKQYVGYGAEENCCNCRNGYVPDLIPSDPAVDPDAPPDVPICRACSSYATKGETEQAWNEIQLGTYPAISKDVNLRVAAGRRLQALVNEVVKYPPQETVPVEMALTYCQDIKSKCWSAYDTKAKCQDYPGEFCKVGVDWTAPANTCGVPLDIIFFIDESPSVTQTQWEEMRLLIIETVIALNGGKDGGVYGSGINNAHPNIPISQKHRVSIIQFGSKGEQHVPFFFTHDVVPSDAAIGMPNVALTDINAFMGQIAQLKRRYGRSPGSCPEQAMHLARKYLTHTSTADMSGWRNNANGGATIAVMLTDGNPGIAGECIEDGFMGEFPNALTKEAYRLASMNWFKDSVTRFIPIGIGSKVDVGSLLMLSKDMPPTRPYLATNWGSLLSVLDDVTALGCDTKAPTAAATDAPTQKPITPSPTLRPTNSFKCTSAEMSLCDATHGMCGCGDSECSHKVCKCDGKFQCGDASCSVCTAAPTLAPTPTPTGTPTYSLGCTVSDLLNCDPNNAVCSKDSGGSVHCACTSGWGCTDAQCGTCTAAPTPTPTAEPTAAPSFQFGCSATERAACDASVGTCFCADSDCSVKKCGCQNGFKCGNGPCTLCTARPTSAPTVSPTARPTAAPTYGPTN